MFIYLIVIFNIINFMQKILSCIINHLLNKNKKIIFKIK